MLLLVGLRLEILQRRGLAESAAADESPTAATVVTFAQPAAKDGKKAVASVVAASGHAVTLDAPAPAAAAMAGSSTAPTFFAFVGPLGKEGPAPPEAFGATVIVDTLGRADSIYLALKNHGISERQILQLVQALKPVFDSKRESKPLDTFAVTIDTADVITYFHYVQRQRPEEPVVVRRRNGELVAGRPKLQTRVQRAVLSVEIVDNLFNAIRSTGEGDQLIGLVADRIFGAVIDFNKHTRKGDRIGLVFEKEYLGDRFLRYRTVHLARYEGQLVSQVAVGYQDPEGTAGHYDQDGKSLARMFLLSPISYLRISSGFSRRRFHPILKKPVPHLGTDYAARTGTPVRATARGDVVHAGWKGGYGKLVEIRHINGYRTRYAHLSRISVNSGQRVRQDQEIGRVGATGRATGPHLHYELIKNGVHMDPERANRNTKGKPLKQQHLGAFMIRYAQLSQELDNRTDTSHPTLAAREAD